jgi:methyl-accepting chemotaxis protein
MPPEPNASSARPEALQDAAGKQRRRSKPLIRSAGIRFALVYAVLFGLSAFILAFALWYSTVALLQREVELAVRNDASALNDHFTTGGLPSLVTAIHERLAANLDGGGIYLLLDPMGNHVIGNLDRWPAGLDEINTWYELPVSRQGVKSVALLRAFPLNGGGRLLVGRDDRARTELRDVLQYGLLWALGIMCALGLIGAALMRSLFRGVIRDISATTRGIALGDLTRRMNKSGENDEFDELADIINDMLERIARLMDGVRQVSNAIAHDLRTPITRARTRLEDASLHATTTEDLHSAIERAAAA